MMMPSEVNHCRFGSKDIELGAGNLPMVEVLLPSSLRPATDLDIGRHKAATHRAQVRMPLADVVQECCPDQVLAQRFTRRHELGGVKTVTLIMTGLCEEHVALRCSEPPSNLIDLGLIEPRGEDH